jgi:hypothetical protein
MTRFTSKYWIVLFAPVFASCAPGWGPMDSNQYVHATAEPAPDYAVGTWTGGLGPYVMTMKIAADGYVDTCHSWNHRDAVGKAKYSHGRLYFSDGSYAMVDKSAKGITVTPLGDEDHASDFVRDESLRLAAPHCEDYFRKQ